jgi:protein-S-isoprenylcysteine O-methyltransferase Ste14
MLAMTAGAALVSGHGHALVGLAIVAAALGRKLLLEERRMRETFGAEWEGWRRRSWALIPGLV